MGAKLLKSIKGSLTTYTVTLFLVMTISILWLSINEHERLYKEAVTQDLEALSENMANDLIPFMAESNNDIELITKLLKLDTYENVIIGAVYNNEWQLAQFYIGKSDAVNKAQPLTHLPNNIQNYAMGIHTDSGQLLSLKRIGEVSYPLGYLLIIKDAQTPLQQSNLSLLKNISPLAIVILCLVVYFLIKLQSELLIPLTRLADLANFVKDNKDYSVRFDVGGKEEVQLLSADFNDMMVMIDEETQKNNEITLRLKEQQRQMEKMANFDPLTELPNRQFFMESLRIELDRAQREGKNLALMYMDLDGFKEVNDSFGHDVGDELLIQVTKRIKAHIRRGDVLSRLGGDEFLLLLHNSPDPLLLQEVANRIVTSIEEPVKVGAWEVEVSISIGIAEARQANFKLSEFMANADIAMYRSKEAGKGCHTSFLPEMMEDNKRKLAIASAILPGLQNDEFQVYYQPKVNVNGEVVGYEALIRWIESKLGFVSPAEFIPIAEATGRVVFITEWMIKKVFDDLSSLIEIHGPQLKVSINLSATDIKRIELLNYIERSYQMYGVDPKNTEFEVTESSYLENFEEADKFLQELSKIGASIALDDFGTGYSSLGYLTKIPIDTLKIDKQFIDELEVDERSTLITTTIIQLAKQLNLTICAEGVETEKQKDYLFNKECDQLQGYYFSKPTPLKGIQKLRRGDADTVNIKQKA